VYDVLLKDQIMYRTIQGHIWEDEWFQELHQSGKLLFLYLLTNIRQTACGAFRITFRTLSVDLGCDKDAVNEALDALREAGKVVWWPGESVVWVKNFYKYQRANSSDKFRISAAKALSDFPQAVQETVLITYPELADYRMLPDKRDTQSIPYPEPTDTEPIGVARKTETETETKAKTKQNSKNSPAADAADVKPLPLWEQQFEEFWKAYPRRNGTDRGSKATARAAFEKMTAAERAEALAQVGPYASSPAARKENGKYVPDAVRWLKEKRWEVVADGLLPFSVNGNTPPEGYSFDKDEDGNWIHLGGDRNGRLPYGAADLAEVTERHQAKQREVTSNTRPGERP
jgi:hypothetical protein